MVEIHASSSVVAFLVKPDGLVQQYNSLPLSLSLSLDALRWFMGQVSSYMHMGSTLYRYDYFSFFFISYRVHQGQFIYSLKVQTLSLFFEIFRI